MCFNFDGLTLKIAVCVFSKKEIEENILLLNLLMFDLVS